MVRRRRCGGLGFGAIFAPEGAPAEIAGAEEGAALIETGGYLSAIGATLQGAARAGARGAATALALSALQETLVPRAVGKVFSGIDEASKAALSSLLRQIPEAVAKEQAACGPQ